MKKLISIMIRLPLMLASCGSSVLVDGMPLVSVVRYPDGSESVFQGRIMPKMDFSSTFTMSSKEGLDCAGAFGANAQGAMECSDGLALNLQIPKEKYGRTNGSYVERTGDVGFAVGWGVDAEAEMLRGLF